MQLPQGNIQYTSGGNIRRLGIHQIADIAQQDILIAFASVVANFGKVLLLVDPHHACNYDDHSFILDQRFSSRCCLS